MVGRGVVRFKKGVCSKRVSGSVVLEAFSSRARFICTTVVQIGVAVVRGWHNVEGFQDPGKRSIQRRASNLNLISFPLRGAVGAGRSLTINCARQAKRARTSAFQRREK